METGFRDHVLQSFDDCAMLDPALFSLNMILVQYAQIVRLRIEQETIEK